MSNFGLVEQEQRQSRWVCDGKNRSERRVHGGYHFHGTFFRPGRGYDVYRLAAHSSKGSRIR